MCADTTQHKMVSSSECSVDERAFADRVAEWAFNRRRLEPVVPLIKERVEKFTEIVPLAGFLFSGLPAYGEDAFARARRDLGHAREDWQACCRVSQALGMR